MLKKEIQEIPAKQKDEYSTPEELEMFEKLSNYFNILRENTKYLGGNNLKEMLDFCQRNNLRREFSELKKLKSPF